MDTHTRFLLTLIASLGIQAATADSARADIYLVGAQLYQAGSQGQNASAYQYSTNSSTTHEPFRLNGGSGSAISFLLTGGANIFAFTPNTNESFDPGSFVGLNLFFNTSGASYNPAYPAVASGDLTVAEAVGSLVFFTPTAGQSILSYGTDGSSIVTAPANGFASFVLDGKSISVGSFSVNHNPSGSFTINLASVPESGSSLALLAIPTAGLFAFRHRQGKGCPG